MEKEIQGQKQSSKAYRMEIFCKCATYWFCLTNSLDNLALSVKNTSPGPNEFEPNFNTNTAIHLKLNYTTKLHEQF